MTMGLRMGPEMFYQYFQSYGLLEKTGIDIPGEAGTIMHKLENIGEVELATMTFGQSFQITPVQLAVMASSVVNGGKRVTPHFGVAVQDREGNVLRTFEYPVKEGIVTEEVSASMREILEKVVSEGGGNKAYIEGYRIGGKTATSQTLPRSAHKYISSFLGFAPADDPQVLAVCIVHDPQGVYYGGTVCAPVVRNIFENILPYLGIEKEGE
jgi:stage V sporulation protein D (sporulation-specific penicillin-binding protein)